MIEIVEPSWEILTNLAGIEQHIERCGRTCYQSQDKITDSSAEKFVLNICRNRHESVLEHASITVVIRCSRACSHQLVRHRLAAYSQQSQRYCDSRKTGLQVVCPPSIGLEPGVYGVTAANVLWIQEDPGALPLWAATESQRKWVEAVGAAYASYKFQREQGIPAEDARFMLPNATATEVATTFNLRQWRHVFKTRCDRHAQWEIRGIFTTLLEEFSEAMPAVFSDISAGL